MKTLIFLLLLMPIFAVAAERVWVVPFVKVVDGDTIQTTISALPVPLNNFKIRLLGIDTPEKGYRAKCEKEKLLGQKSTTYLTGILSGTKTITIKNFKHDKYGGRINADVYVDGMNIGQKMIEEGFAKPYSGVGLKPNWCN